MPTQNSPGRSARSMTLVIIGVAIAVAIAVGLLAAGAPLVVATPWVLLVGLALLVTWWLVLNLLGGVVEKTPGPIARITALVIIGVALLAAGLSAVTTLWLSSFVRFMYLEDLGMTSVAEITRDTPVDRGLLILGGILAVLGATSVFAAAVLARQRWRAGQ